MESAAPKKVEELDLQGQVCPATLLKALQTINKLKESLREGGTVLVIRTDHRDATVTIPGAASSMRFDVSVTKEKSWYRITVACHAAAKDEGKSN